ncbi:RNA polymerase sigma factor [Clostridiaceae bacterium 35-E11]
MKSRRSIISLIQRHKADHYYVIKRIHKKDVVPFIDWIEERKDKYYKIGWAYLYNEYDIEDVFQNTIIKVYENIAQLREEKYFETWVAAIFINECKRILRNRKRESITENIEAMEGSYQDAQKMEFKEILNQLEEINKEVILLKYISGYSQQEIADILEIPIGTVKSRIYRGLKALRNEMDQGVF